MGKESDQVLRYILAFLLQGSALQACLWWEGGEETGQVFLYLPGQGCRPFQVGCSYFSSLQWPLTPSLWQALKCW